MLYHNNLLEVLLGNEPTERVWFLSFASHQLGGDEVILGGLAQRIEPCRPHFFQEDLNT